MSTTATAATAADIILQMRVLAAATPEYRYRPRGIDCVNVELDDDGVWVGSCLVGKACVAAGIPAVTIAIRARGYPSDGLLAMLRIAADIDQSAWIWRAQRVQDEGGTWGRAIELADTLVPRIARFESTRFLHTLPTVTSPDLPVMAGSTILR